MNFLPHLRAIAIRTGGGPGALVALGLALATVSALDPYRTSGRVLGPLLALLGVAAARRRDGRFGRRVLMTATLATTLAVAASGRPQFLAPTSPSTSATSARSPSIATSTSRTSGPAGATGRKP